MNVIGLSAKLKTMLIGKLDKVFSRFEKRLENRQKLKSLKRRYKKAVKEKRELLSKGDEINAYSVELQEKLLWLAYNEKKPFWYRNLR